MVLAAGKICGLNIRLRATPSAIKDSLDCVTIRADPNTLTNLKRQKRGSSFSLFQVITINGYLNHTMVLIKPLPTKTRLWPFAQLSPML